MENQNRDGEAPVAGTNPLARVRATIKDRALQSALRKREAGVPSYTVAEAAALCSVSVEHLYRLVRAGAFPAVRLRLGEAETGRYVVPASAIEEILASATNAGGVVDVADWARGGAA